MPSILFVCTANRFRSPIAAALFAKRLQQEQIAQGWSVGSAGTWAEPGLPVIPPPLWANKHLGVDLGAHRAIRIDHQLLTEYNLILVMENNHAESLRVEFPEIKRKVHLLTKVAGGVAYDIPDPGDVPGDTFLDIANELADLIDKGFQKIYLLACQRQA